MPFTKAVTEVAKHLCEHQLGSVKNSGAPREPREDGSVVIRSYRMDEDAALLEDVLEVHPL